MRQLTSDEVAQLETAERRRRAAERYRIRLDAVRGATAFIDDLLADIGQASDRRRIRLEPDLLIQKARYLRAQQGLPVAIAFFQFSAEQIIDPLLEQP